MSKKAFEKISAGLKDALSMIVRYEDDDDLWYPVNLRNGKGSGESDMSESFDRTDRTITADELIDMKFEMKCGFVIIETTEGEWRFEPDGSNAIWRLFQRSTCH